MDSKNYRENLPPNAQLIIMPSQADREKEFFQKLKFRFKILHALHQGVEWEGLKDAMKRDPEAKEKVMALNAKGHRMSASGQNKQGDYILISTWTNVDDISDAHQFIAFDEEAQARMVRNYPNERCNGNASKIITDMEVSLATQEGHSQLIQAVPPSMRWEGYAYLKTDSDTRTSGFVWIGRRHGVTKENPLAYVDNFASFRAQVEVKKAA